MTLLSQRTIILSKEENEKEGFLVKHAAYFRDTWAEINLDHIFENVKNMKQHIKGGTKLFAVVKANGYGHGDYQVAKTALEAGADYLAVAFLDEAIALREKGIEAPILVLGATRPEDATIAANFNIAVTIFHEEWLIRAVEHFRGEQPLKVHIKCDTGMGRLGIREKEELRRLVDQLLVHENFLFEGIYTHFATADELTTTFYEQQLARFKELLSGLDSLPELVHCSNSAASLRFEDAQFNAVRMGISMYGLTPSQEMKEILPFPLKESFSLHTKLVHVKEIKAGDAVSYGATYIAKENEWIGTIPIGYADGWIRKLQGFKVIVDGKLVPIVGRICMDQCMIKLPSKYPIGEKVTLIGENNGMFVSVDDVAEKLETINYEVTCMIGNRVPRVYKKDEKTVFIHNPLHSLIK